MIDSIKKTSQVQSTQKRESNSTLQKISNLELDNETKVFLSNLSEVSETKKREILLERLIINSLTKKIGLKAINEPKTAEMIKRLKSTLIDHPEIQQHLGQILKEII